MLMTINIHLINKSHTRMTVRKCFNGDKASQWKRPELDPS